MTKSAQDWVNRPETGPTELEIVDRIVAAVMEQRLPPGTKLSEAKLCETFGAGRMRVRRSLLLLSNQGIVDLESNRGAFIARPDAKEAHDIFSARSDIETAVIRRIARQANSRDIAILEEHVGAEDAARAKGDRREVIRLSGEFHIKLAEVSDNGVILRILRELVTRTSLLIALFGTKGVANCPDHEHADIVSAIRDGDAPRAEMMMRHHLRHIEEGLNLAQSGEPKLDLAEILRSA